MPTAELFDLSGRISIVTGGNGGIGRAIALGLARAGVAVAVLTTGHQLLTLPLTRSRRSRLGRNWPFHPAVLTRSGNWTLRFPQSVLILLLWALTEMTRLFCLADPEFFGNSRIS